MLLWRIRDLWWLEAVVAAIVTFLVTFTFNDWLAAHLAETNPLIAVCRPPARVLDFLLGMCTAVAFERLSQRHISRTVATVLELAAFAIVVATVTKTHDLVDVPVRSFHLGLAARAWTMDVGLVALPFAFLILILALGRGHVTSVLSWRPLVALGESSYSLYLIHYPLVLIATGLIAVHAPAGLPRVLAYATYFPITIGAALLMWYCVERPCRRILLGRWLRQFGPGYTPTGRTIA